MPADPSEYWAALVPEILVTDLDRSLAFYVDLCGFRTRFIRPEDGFAYLERGQAQIMLEEVAEDRWQTADLSPPFGRGINLQIEVADVLSLHARVTDAGWPLFRPITTQWYREGRIEHGQTEFLLQDPDGYLIRFMQPLGQRPADTRETR
jgi:catechol 2,3-dioxygenase-like lactoylglutathione lyase family enzyme